MAENVDKEVVWSDKSIKLIMAIKARASNAFRH